MFELLQTNPMCSVSNAVRFALIVVFIIGAFVFIVDLSFLLFVCEHVMLSNLRLAEQL